MPTDSITHEELLHELCTFLDSHGYHNTLLALQAESGIPYNTIRVNCTADSLSPLTTVNRKKGAPASSAAAYPAASPENLERCVLDGEWAEVLAVYVDRLLLPEEVKAGLYELIFEELLHVHGLQPAARALLTNAPIFTQLRTTAPARVARLEKMLQDFDRFAWEEQSQRAGTGTVVTQTRSKREAVLKNLKAAIRFSSEPYGGALASALVVARHCTCGGGGGAAGNSSPPALGHKRSRAEDTVAANSATPHALSEGSGWADTFLEYPLTAPREIVKKFAYEEQKGVSRCLVTYGAASAPLLIIGRSDGAVDFVDPKEGKPVANSVGHTDGVLSMALDVVPADLFATPCSSSTAEPIPAWLAVGYRDGAVKVFNTGTCKLARRFPKAHAMGVTSVIFSGLRMPDVLNGHLPLLVTGSFDACIHVLSIEAAATLATVTDGHHGAFINAICGLNYALGSTRSSVVAAFMSAGNDGMLSFWSINSKKSDSGGVGLHRLGLATSLRSIYGEFKEEIPIDLVSINDGGASISRQHSAFTGMEVLVLTRSCVAMLASVEVRLGDSANPVVVTVLCVIRASVPLRSGLAHARHVASLPVPVLTIIATDTEGTLQLYSIRMDWRSAERWAQFAGVLRVVEPTDSSASVLVDHGRAVPDLQVACAWGKDSRMTVFEYSSSIPFLYVLQ